MTTRLLLDQSLFDTRCLLATDDNLDDLHWSLHTEPDETGALYYGRVVEINRGMSAAFVELGPHRTGLLRLRKGIKVTEGQKLVVQITDIPAEDHKAAHVTTRPTIAGRTVVLRPGTSGLEVSRQIETTERDRLKTLYRDAIPADMGLTLRTTAGQVPETEVRAEITALTSHWQRLTQTPPRQSGLIWRDTAIAQALKTMTPTHLDQILVSTAQLYNDVRHILGAHAPALLPALQKPNPSQWAEHAPLWDQVNDLASPVVLLPDDGQLMIEHTQAMTVIDVDGGGTQSAQEANWTAARALKHHLHLRRIGGMVVVDFITLPKEEARRFGDRLRHLFHDDPDVERIGGPSPNGLVEIIRKRRGAALAQTLAYGTNPETDALWRMKPATVAAEICRLIPRVAQDAPAGAVEIICAPTVAQLLQEATPDTGATARQHPAPRAGNTKADPAPYQHLSATVGRTIHITEDASLSVDQFSLEVAS